MSKDNRWDNLLTSLDAVYGGSDVTQSRYRTERQGFDNDRGEHFVTLQYFYRRNTHPHNKELKRDKKQRKEQNQSRAKMPVHRARKERNQKQLALLQAVNSLARQQRQIATGGLPLT